MSPAGAEPVEPDEQAAKVVSATAAAMTATCLPRRMFFMAWFPFALGFRTDSTNRFDGTVGRGALPGQAFEQHRPYLSVTVLTSFSEPFTVASESVRRRGPAARPGMMIAEVDG
ncbi:hypothetical protein L3i22_066230 [Actinoplanes sp. L3-i22]|nr:hypothetical protein L3i22_066230 [Actinoplanes sp. L3-i22]